MALEQNVSTLSENQAFDYGSLRQRLSLDHFDHIGRVSQVLFSDATYVGITHPLDGRQFPKQRPWIFRNELVSSLDNCRCPCRPSLRMNSSRWVNRTLLEHVRGRILLCGVVHSIDLGYPIIKNLIISVGDFPARRPSTTLRLYFALDLINSAISRLRTTYTRVWPIRTSTDIYC